MPILFSEVQGLLGSQDARFKTTDPIRGNTRNTNFFKNSARNPPGKGDGLIRGNACPMDFAKCLDETNRKKVMKTHVKTLIAIVIGGTLGAAAYAGPAGVYSNGGFASNTNLMAPQPTTAPETIALYRTSVVAPGEKVTTTTTLEEARLIPSGNPKSPGVMIEVAPGSILE
jgi:hypothetical protein